MIPKTLVSLRTRGWRNRRSPMRRWVVLVVACLAVTGLGALPADAHVQGRANTSVIDTSSSQCTVGADWQSHTFYQVQVWSMEDGINIVDPWNHCQRQNARPAGNLRLAARWYTNGRGPCAPQNWVQGPNNDGFYTTNASSTVALKWEFTIDPKGLWPWCNLGYSSNTYMSMDTWQNIHTYKGQNPPYWLGGTMINAVGHDYGWWGF